MMKIGKHFVDLAIDITRIFSKGSFTEMIIAENKSQWLKITGRNSSYPWNVATNGVKEMEASWKDIIRALVLGVSSALGGH